MILHSGLPTSFLIEFPSGNPDGDISWSLLNDIGGLITSGTLIVPDSAVSIYLPIAGANNTLSNGQYVSSRDVVWTYTVNGEVITGEARYSIEARTPLGASPAGVRSKLGLSDTDLPDTEISMMSGYLAFIRNVPVATINSVSDNGAITLLMRNAVEAAVALALIPTLSVRVAAAEDSGTNSYKRQTIDWDALGAALASIYLNGIVAALPDYDPSSTADIFILATPSADPVTGAAYV